MTEFFNQKFKSINFSKNYILESVSNYTGDVNKLDKLNIYRHTMSL